MTLAQYDSALVTSEMLRQGDQAKALATFKSGGGGPSAYPAYDAALKTAEIAHLNRRLAAAVAYNPAAASDVLVNLRARGQV